MSLPVSQSDSHVLPRPPAVVQTAAFATTEWRLLPKLWFLRGFTCPLRAPLSVVSRPLRSVSTSLFTLSFLLCLPELGVSCPWRYTAWKVGIRSHFRIQTLASTFPCCPFAASLSVRAVLLCCFRHRRKHRHLHSKQSHNCELSSTLRTDCCGANY